MTVTLRTAHAGDGIAVGAEAIVFCGPGRPLERIGVPAVVLRPGEALAAVELVLLCPDDRRLFTGELPSRSPLVPGHEQVGRVVAVAERRPPRDVDGRRLRPGDRIVWAAGVGCGRCVRCRSGEPARCPRLHRYGRDRVERGWELSGGCATHVQLLAGTAVLRIDDELSAAEAAAAGHGAFQGAELRAGLRRAGSAIDEVFLLADAARAFEAALDPGLRVALRP